MCISSFRAQLSEQEGGAMHAASVHDAAFQTNHGGFVDEAFTYVENPMKQFLALIVLLVGAYAAGTQNDRIAEFGRDSIAQFQEWRAESAARAQEDAFASLPMLAAECEQSAKSVDNYGALVIQEKTGKQKMYALTDYKTMAKAHDQKIKDYAKLWAKYKERDQSLPEPKTFLRPIEAPNPEPAATVAKKN